MDEQLYYYEMRMTPHPNNEYMTKEYRGKIPHFVRLIGGINYLFGQEYENNYHFHIVFSHPLKFALKKKCPKRDEIRDVYYSEFDVPKPQRGNPSFELSPIRNLEHTMSYVTKDGDYEASPEWIQIAEDAYSKSFTKKHSMKRSLGDLIDQYTKGEINDRKLWIGLGLTRSELELPLSIRWMDEMLLSIQCKKNPELLEELWEEKIQRLPHKIQ